MMHAMDKEAIYNKCEEKVSTSGNTTNMVKVSDVLFVLKTICLGR